MMVKTEYICNLCRSSYTENAQDYILGVHYLSINSSDLELRTPYQENNHVCLNCLRGLEKALKANWVQKLLNNSENALDEVLNGNEWRQEAEEKETWATYPDEAKYRFRNAWIAEARLDFADVWQAPQHTINSFNKLEKELLEINPELTANQLATAWWQKCIEKQGEKAKAKAA